MFLCSHRPLEILTVWALTYIQIYYFLQFYYLCLIAFVKIVMSFPMGIFEHTPECVRFFCCVLSATFGEIIGCGTHPDMVVCPAQVYLLSAKHQLIRFRFYLAKSRVLTAYSSSPEKSDACSRVAGT